MSMALARAALAQRDQCEHWFEKIDPRDEKQLGMYGWHCAECGAARPEREMP